MRLVLILSLLFLCSTSHSKEWAEMITHVNFEDTYKKLTSTEYEAVKTVQSGVTYVRSSQGELVVPTPEEEHMREGLALVITGDESVLIKDNGTNHDLEAQVFTDMLEHPRLVKVSGVELSKWLKNDHVDEAVDFTLELSDYVCRLLGEELKCRGSSYIRVYSEQ